MTSTNNLYEYYVKRKKAPRAAEKAATYGTAITEAGHVAELVRRIIGKDEPREHIILLYLDVANNVIGYNHHAVGTDKEVPAYPREIYRAALLAGAASLILVHNHPSGRCEPSDSDDALTSRMVDASNLIGIPLLDHVVVSETSHYSYAEKGKLR